MSPAMYVPGNDMHIEVALPLPLKNLFSYSVPEHLISQVKIGQQVLVPFRNRSLKGIIVNVNGYSLHPSQKESGLSNYHLKQVYSILNPSSSTTQILLDLTRWISEKYGCSWGESLSVLSPSFKKAKRPLRQIPVEKIVDDLQAWSPGNNKKIVLTDEQSAAVHAIDQSIFKNEFKSFLLFGVTSSGKTEVYLNAIQKVIESFSSTEPNKKKQALFLVPEISLCPPFYEILKQRFGDLVGVWHSQLPLSEKNRSMNGLKDGSIQIIVGARSALFAPFERLGVIIIDEEHDFSYKQDEKPRYHSRDVAIQLARYHQAVVIMGSATPSIESYYNAEQGEITLLKLTSRVPSQSLPKITLIDKKKSIIKNSREERLGSSLTPDLIEQITITLARREQVILALNRRGYSTFVICTACGTVVKCVNCLLTLIHHREFIADGNKDHLECHYCLEKTSIPGECGKCKSQSLLFGGFGTQKVVQDIKRKFPLARVFRLDRDISKKKSQSADVYQSFKNESGDILIGTQMVTQGYDFPRVTLVGIIDTDTALYHPDFRAAEKTFQWISQAAGRSGRSVMGGRVIIQSSIPDHYALTNACSQSYKEFFKKELDFRKELRYPPYSELILFRIQSADKHDLIIKESDRLYQDLKSKVQSKKVQFLGPGPSPRENLLKQKRWQIMVKCPKGDLLKKVIEAGRSFVPKKGVRVVLDVDPYNIL